MPDPTIPPSDAEDPSQADTARLANRRRLLQGGLAAGPVLMTLISRPVLATPGALTPSAFASGNVSLAAQGVATTGRTPGYWKQSQHYSSWKPPFYPTTLQGPGGHKATLFDAVCTPQYAGKTLLDVLEMGGGPPNDVARHIVAALLNAAAQWTSVPSIQTVKGIWSEYVQKGYFEPTAGAKWDHTQIVTYLQSTMPL